MKKFYRIKNRYADSVMLMNVADKINRLPGIEGAECGMGTRANIDLLTGLGYAVDPDTGKNDLMIAIDAAEDRQEEIYGQALDFLEHRGASAQVTYNDINEIDTVADPFDLVQISLPGEYAAPEIEKALRKGLDCFVFSDNVSLEDERRCKELARSLGRLVMGPDAGVGLIDGVALAAGSIVRDGKVGIIGASGSGAQEVACLIEKMGEGVSRIIGTGGRDLRPEIGGITMLSALEKLKANERTEVICLVSKLADPGVMEKVLSAAEGCGKPVVAVFLGAPESIFAGKTVHGAHSLKDAAVECVSLLRGEKVGYGRSPGELDTLAERIVAGLPAERKYFRGLYCGGTFTEEAMILFHKNNPDVPLYSNLDTRYAEKLADHSVSRGHTILDLGAEDFTAEAPHPVFDPYLRLRRVEQEVADPSVGVILLDFITGPGVHRDPILPFVPAIKDHPEICFIATVCGAEGDPQNIGEATAALRDAGCVVAGSNAESAELASRVMALLEKRG